MGRILCIANQKGGVGKTTTAINLSVALAKAQHQTLLVDLDPQCNATTGLGFTPSEQHPLISDLPLTESLQQTTIENLQLLCGSRSFNDAQRLSESDDSTAHTLSAHLAAGLTSFDYVLIDCPPTLGRLTETALASSSEVLMPIQCEYFAMEGLSQMIEVIRRVIHEKSGRLGFAGILLTMVDESLELTGEVEEEVRDFFGEIVYQTVIPRDVAVSEAPSHGQSVIEYSPRSRGCRAYTELCMEVLNHV